MLLHVLLLLGPLLGARACQNNFPGAFDVGFYWARRPDMTDTKILWEKSCPSENHMSSHFNPAKKTLIMTHGLQPDMIMLEQQFAMDGMLDDYIGIWLRSGYNVGVFIWTCFADERVPNFVYSEDQIYTTRGFVKMRYKVKTAEGRIKVMYAPQNMTVTDYFIEQWRFHFANGQTYPDIRMVGHSLGTQVTMNSAFRIHMDDTIDTKPARIALLDAVMSPARKMYYDTSTCGDTISRNMGCMARFLNIERDVPIEYYKSSFINRCLFSSIEYDDLIKYTAYTVVKIHAWGMHPLGSCWDKRLLHHIKDIKKYAQDLATQVTWQHVVIVPYYLMTIVFAPHRCLLTANKTACTPISALAGGALMSDEDVLYWSRPLNQGEYADKLCFVQFDECEVAGRQIEDAATMTVTSVDDTFFLKPCINAHI